MKLPRLNIIILADHNIGYNIVDYILGIDNHNVLGVFTNKKSGKEWWNNIGELKSKYSYIKFLTYENETTFVEEIKQNKEIDLILLLSWRHLMSEEVFNIPQLGVVNLHYSLLPKYRGTYPNCWAIIEGEKHTGVTFHWIDKGIDSGNIIAQSEIKIDRSDTSKSLLSKLDQLALLVFKDIWHKVNEWKKESYAQPKSNRIYYSNVFVKTNEIDINRSMKIEAFINLLRGKSFYPEYKNTYFLDPDDNKKVFINIILEKEK